MMKPVFKTLIASVFFFCSAFTNTSHADMVNYLNIAGPIKFGNKEYNLSWSSHPADNYYKQEYLVKSDDANKYTQMLLVDLITGTDDIKQVLSGKVAELTKMKKTNPVVNFEVIENKATGEYMLDFLVSENTPDGKYLSIVERNVYRYKKIKTKSGKKGVLLFGVSVRSYGDAIDDFFAKLKGHRDDLLNDVGQFSIPEVNIAE